MASKKKGGTAAKATKAKPAKAVAPKVEAAKAAPKAKAKKAAAGTAEILIPRGQYRHNHVKIGVNGRIRALATGCKLTVDAAEIEALDNSRIRYETISPLAAGEGSVEGSSEPSTEAPSEGGETETGDQGGGSGDGATPDAGEATA